MDIELRYVGEDEYAAFIRAAARGFGSQISDDMLPVLTPPLKHGRILAAYEGGNVVGTFAVFPLAMNVPEGRSARTAVVSEVAVLPTHRRRGILTRMMERQLREAYEAGDVLANLGASESVIYGRFGFGIATYNERWSIDRRHAAIEHAPRSEGRVRFVERADVMPLFPEVAARACADRPGFTALRAEHWEQFLADFEQMRDNPGGPYNFAVYEEDGQTDGYVIYRIRGNTVVVQDLMAATAAAHIGLWRFCFGIDLRETIESSNRPTDDPLPWMLADPRRLSRTLADCMWLRALDARKALEARSYAREGRVTLELRDDFCAWNAGRYELEGGPDGARCKRTTAAADIALSAADLGAAYLGTASLSRLARASRVEARDAGALRVAEGMFGARMAGWWPHEL